MTTASYLRKFVTQHKAYQKDSIVNEEITWLLASAPCFPPSQC